EILVVKKVGLFADMFESLTMQVAWRTPLEKLDTLERLMNEWLSTEENRWFQPSTSVVIQHIEFQRYLTITLGIGHNGCAYHILFLLFPFANIGGPFLTSSVPGRFDRLSKFTKKEGLILNMVIQDWDLRNKRKTAFHAAVQYYCQQLDITFYESSIPIVYADPKTKRYVPPSQLPQAPESLAAPGDSTLSLNIGENPNAEPMKPLLGFLPPESTRSQGHLKTRRSKSRKAAMRGMDAD
ncbi:hypothetical protein C0995_004341, partial [Termitomyces sp. Mi166